MNYFENVFIHYKIQNQKNDHVNILFASGDPGNLTFSLLILPWIRLKSTYIILHKYLNFLNT